MANKVRAKKWNLGNVSKAYTYPELLAKFHKAAIYEINCRKVAIKSLTNFKKWWNAYLECDALLLKTNIINGELKNKKDQTDEDKDFLSERRRIFDDLNERSDNLISVWKMIIKNKNQVSTYLKDKDLAKYKTKFHLRWFVHSNHIISDEDEKFLKRSSTIRNLENLYEAILEDKSTDLVLDENDKPIKETTWKKAFTCDNKVIRQNTYAAWNSQRSKKRNTLFALACAAVKAKNFEARCYKYKNWLDKEVKENYLLDLNDFYFCIDQGDKFAPITIKYNNHRNNLIKEAFGLDEYGPWDSEIDFKDTKDEISIQEAQQDIIKALSCLGQDYINKVKQCFDANIINWDKNQTAAQNGYCYAGSNDIDENLINFVWKGESISACTLGHELGHNIKNKFMKEHNEIDNICNNLLSEIPSIVNSILMGLYYLEKFNKNNTPKEKVYGMYKSLLGYLINNISYNAFVHQFLDVATRKIETDRKITLINLECGYLDFKKAWYGLSKSEFAKLDKKWPYWLEKMDAYPTLIGFCLDYGGNELNYYIGSIVALPIAWKIYIGDKVTLNRYIKFLKHGTGVNPIKIVKDTLDIDLLKPQVYTEAKKVLDNLVNDFIRNIKI